MQTFRRTPEILQNFGGGESPDLSFEDPFFSQRDQKT